MSGGTRFRGEVPEDLAPVLARLICTAWRTKFSPPPRIPRIAPIVTPLGALFSHWSNNHPIRAPAAIEPANSTPMVAAIHGLWSFFDRFSMFFEAFAHHLFEGDSSLPMHTHSTRIRSQNALLHESREPDPPLHRYLFQGVAP